MGKYVADNFQNILSCFSTHDILPFYYEMLRLRAGGVDMKDIAWRLMGALTYVATIRTHGEL